MIIALLGLALSGCARRGIAIVQRHHAHEFVCDARFVRVERGEADRYVSRGCGFEADWDCARGSCALRDARSHGVGAP